VSLAPPFGITIDLIHNANQKIKANISKRAKFALAYIYILLSSHQAVTAHSHHFNDMFSAKAKTLQNHHFQNHPFTTRSPEWVFMGGGFL
jgi:UDP-N-acetylglucosamine 2-epimerase